ncbi:HAD family hydrolase [Zobellia barbeyronii]|uniref:HAD family phosphatase n=1 Tax=Zobellia barbeyronii TaxID=2748009 RepID=A0ABS5WC71_9FLAO|nr:HAD family phosphatase [Zobellia barbeyronii]MBT2161001.1 HAD family phosphatase [Zobellia barbeyronii]
MIKNIIFDFGDVFINLDKGIIFREMEKFGGSIDLTPEMIALNGIYEVGGISSEEFIAQLQSQYPKASAIEIENIWNSMLLDFPEERLEFIENLAKEGEYRLFLLSNTNDLHITHVAQKMGSDRYERFQKPFEKFYLSHEINLRKPNAEIYQFVLDENGLKAEETFFIDDTKENTDAAEKLGITCWNIQVGKEDIVQLKSKL